MIAGIDVSEEQGVINWPQVAQAGIRFAIMKCYEGNKGLDPFFKKNVAGAKAAGIGCGAYQFIYPIGLPNTAQNPHRDPVSQAQLHWANSDGLGCAKGDLQVFMDLEWPGDPSQWGTYGCSKAQLQDYVGKYKETYESLSGCLVGFYTDKYWWSTVDGPTLSQYYNVPFWSAYPSDITHGLPPLFTPLLYKPFATCSIWQYSWRLSVPGIVDAVDGNCIPDEDTYAALTNRP